MEKNVNEYVWSQMYRPQRLDDVIIPEAIKKQFKGYVRDGQIQNLLLSSASPGTGKTTTALALCNELGVKPLFINASLNNGIDDIRSLVVQYATTVSLMGNRTKIVIMDECDRLSGAAQDSLKGIIEEVSRNCRFIMTCNTISQVTTALRSRLTLVEFAFSNEDMRRVSAEMYKRSCEILEDQGVTHNKASVAAVVKAYVPDNRGLIERLQAYAVAHKQIDEGVIVQIAQGDLDSLIGFLRKKEFDKLKGWCFDNQDKLSGEFYGKFFLKMEPLINKQTSMGELVIIIDEWQTKHKEVPDRFIHFLAMMTHVMMRVVFN